MIGLWVANLSYRAALLNYKKLRDGANELLNSSPETL